jgi:hypothetical protein
MMLVGSGITVPRIPEHVGSVFFHLFGLFHSFSLADEFHYHLPDHSFMAQHDIDSDVVEANDSGRTYCCVAPEVATCLQTPQL